MLLDAKASCQLREPKAWLRPPARKSVRLLFQLFLLFNRAQCPLQEVDDCRLVFCRVLPKMLHMRGPRKPCRRESGALPSPLFKHFTFEVLLREVVVRVGVEEELLHLLVKMEMVPAKVARPNTLDDAQLKLFALQSPQQIRPASFNEQPVAADSCIGAVETVFARTVPVDSKESGDPGNGDLRSGPRTGVPDNPTDIELAPRCQLKALIAHNSCIGEAMDKKGSFSNPHLLQLIDHLRHHLRHLLRHPEDVAGGEGHLGGGAALVKINVGVFGKIFLIGASPSKEEGEGRRSVRSNNSSSLSSLAFLWLLHFRRQHRGVGLAGECIGALNGEADRPRG